MFQSSGTTRAVRRDPFEAVAKRSVFQRVREEYDAAVAADTPVSKLQSKFGCRADLWFQQEFAPPYNWLKSEARDELFRTYMFMSSTELAVRLERDHKEHTFPVEGETLTLIPNGSGGYPIFVRVEQVRLPPRKNPKTAILVIKQL